MGIVCKIQFMYLLLYHKRMLLLENNDNLVGKKWSVEFVLNSGIVNFKFKDFNAAVEDLSSCVKLDKNNKSAYTYLVSIKRL